MWSFDGFLEGAAGAAAGGGLSLDLFAAEAEKGFVPFGDFDAGGGDVVADETAAEAGFGGVGETAVDD